MQPSVSTTVSGAATSPITVRTHSGTQQPSFAPPKLLVELEPRSRAFRRNLIDCFVPQRSNPQDSVLDSAPFWPDVFVSSGLPWSQVLGSFALHILVIAMLGAASRVLILRPHAVPQVEFSKPDVIYFSTSEYLPPLDTGASPATAQRGDPERAPQPIISVPPEADNGRQTIVTPPDVKLKTDIPLPNVVAWDSASPPVPMAATNNIQAPLSAPDTFVVPPTPEVQRVRFGRGGMPEAAVVAPPAELTQATGRVITPAVPAISPVPPPPSVDLQGRTIGSLNMAHADVVQPAPALPWHEQRALAAAIPAGVSYSASNIVGPPPAVTVIKASRRSAVQSGSGGYAVVPPPPSLTGSQRSGGAGRIVALGLYPAAVAPPAIVGNRRGSFSAAPSGKSGATGTPALTGSQDIAPGSGGASPGTLHTGLPSGLHVGAASAGQPIAPISPADHASSGVPIPEAKPATRIRATPHRAMEATSPPTEMDREVFGDRKFYSMTLNMPNLNSAGGSWIIRFAELKTNSEKADLMAPEATRKVDPAYPLQLIRSRVQGTVTLYAVIRDDGSVSDVRVLNAVDDRLADFARTALSQWHFRPATKNGSAVDLEAIVLIPFRAVPGF